MSKLELGRQVEIAATLGYDAIDSLTVELAQYDKIYERLGRRAIGRQARSLVAGSAWMYRDLLERDHETSRLIRDIVPDIERDSIESTMTDFAILTGGKYLRSVFDRSFRQNRPYNKEVFPWQDGTTRCAIMYTEVVWAPAYAAEFANAHMLELTSETALALTSAGGNEGVGA